MNFSQVSDNLAIIKDVCSASRMKEWLLAALGIIVETSSDSKLVKDVLNITLHIEEVALSDGTKCKSHALVRKLGEW